MGGYDAGMTLFKDLHAQWLAADPAYRAEIERIEAMGWEAFSAEQRRLWDEPCPEGSTSNTAKLVPKRDSKTG